MLFDTFLEWLDLHRGEKTDTYTTGRRLCVKAGHGGGTKWKVLLLVRPILNK